MIHFILYGQSISLLTSLSLLYRFQEGRQSWCDLGDDEDRYGAPCPSE
jgi:hypothetical protein